VLMKGLAGDIVPLILVAATGGLKGSERDFERLLELESFRPTACVVMAARGYPGSYGKGSVIQGMQAASTIEGVAVFHAGTDMSPGGDLVAKGGRVLNVTASGATLREAVDRAYSGVDAIKWPEGFCRRDIGWRAFG